MGGKATAETEVKEGLGTALDAVGVGDPMPAKVQLPLPALDIGAHGADRAGGSGGPRQVSFWKRNTKTTLGSV